MTSSAPWASWGTLAIFRNNLPPRIARADAAIRITIRLSRHRRRRRSPLARTTRVSPMRPSASRPTGRLIARARVWARSCACVRACDVSLEYARIYLPTPWNADKLAACVRRHSQCGHATTHGWVFVIVSFSLFLFPVFPYTRACVRIYMCDGIWG